MNLKKSPEPDTLLSLECPSESGEENEIQSFGKILKDKWFSKNIKQSDKINISLSFMRSEETAKEKDSTKIEKDIPKRKQENEKSNFLSSSEDEVSDVERKGEEERIPKIVLNKLTLEKVEGPENEKSNNSKVKRDKRIKNEKHDKKPKDKKNKDKTEVSDSDDENGSKRDSSKKSEKNSNCLTSSDEDIVETKKQSSSKTDCVKRSKKDDGSKTTSNKEKENESIREKRDKNKKKKEDSSKKSEKNSNCLTSSDEDIVETKKSSSKTDCVKRSKEDDGSKTTNNKEKENESIREKRNKNKKKKEDKLNIDSSDEDTDSIDKSEKLKAKCAARKNSEKEVNSSEESDKSESKNKLESKCSRKSKLSENNSDDEESTKNKKMKLKNPEKNENDSKRKAKKELKRSKSVESSGEVDSAVVENGAESKGKIDGNEKVQDEESVMEQEDFEGDVNCNDFKLELQASSNENTEDFKMVQVKENESEDEQNKKFNNEKDSSVKNKVKSKFVGLDSSSEEDSKEKKKETPKKRPVRSKKKPRINLVLSSDDEEEVEKLEEPTIIESSDEDGGKKEEKDEDFAVVVESSADSSDSEILPKNKRKNKGSSDSDASISDENKKKKKRRRIKCADSSDESGDSDGGKKGKKNAEGESPAKGGRKNIKKIKKKEDLEQTTIEAAEEEKERRRRIEERQKLFNQVFEVKESAKLEKLVLDFDPDTKKELISVNQDLVAKMKPHQAKGVKFMWDSCFESVKQIKKTKGSGCILAHCMGLGKTFQVISLVHTLLTHEELTKVRTVMVVCPLSTVLNWVNEFGKWLEDVEGGDEIEVFHLTRYNKNPERARELRRWQHNGGVLIMGYEMFRNLTNETTKKFKAKMKKDFLETLIDPGADLIVCDEGHMLKNEATALSKAMTRVKTLRRIVLTGTPMQNNLKEYHCMVQFVKPNLLGTSKEFLNRFVNPINNGQFVDSTDHDVKLMKRRAHVLHKMLEGLVQRFDYNVLTPFLPPKQEYVISVCLSELQEKLYSHYLENESQKAEGMKGGTRLFMDWQTLGRVWTHPRVLKMSTDKANWLKEKKAMEQSDSEGSLRDFIDDDSDKSTTTEESSDEDLSDESGGKKKNKTVHRKSRSTRSTRQNANVNLLESSDEEKAGSGGEDAADDSNKGEWWSTFIEPHHFEDMRQSGKLMLLFAILKECELIEDKVLVFSQSLFSLDLIEYFLDKIDAATQEERLDETLDNHQGTWSKGLDYFRLDGSTSSENRNIWCKAFNREDNPRARLFLISTRAGGLGINLTAANRVIIFDASWNPSHDIQSIFRIYRFGQKKPCYVYRFVAYGTMEEKVYERQVAKQSISNRVVDEQQVHRHFSMNDLTELYTFTPASKLDERPTPALPRDPLMAEILSQMKKWIEKYHEHDSLLENVVEEELNEEERKAAWEDYENDKKRGFLPPAGPQGPSMNPSAAWNQQIEIMRQQLKLRYPTKSDDEINSILVYQVSILMRQQQQQQLQMAATAQLTQMQAANNMGFRQPMFGNNMMGQMGGFTQRGQLQTTPYLRNIAPKPTTQQTNYTPDQVFRMQQQANLMRLQMQQAAQQQQKTQQGKSLQSLLTQPRYPAANMAAAELQRMKQNYQASRQNNPGVVITEIKDNQPSGSSES